MKQVSTYLGNTPTVARKSYVDPRLVDLFNDGITIDPTLASTDDDLGDGTTEIVTVSRWESLEAIKGFAGADVETAVYYPEDERFLVERDDVVRHWTQVS